MEKQCEGGKTTGCGCRIQSTIHRQQASREVEPAGCGFKAGLLGVGVAGDCEVGECSFDAGESRYNEGLVH